MQGLSTSEVLEIVVKYSNELLERLQYTNGAEFLDEQKLNGWLLSLKKIKQELRENQK